jgi:hypothetical protein
MTKLKMDEYLAGLIWVNKVSCAEGFNLFGTTKIGWDFQPKRSVKRRSFNLWITVNKKWFIASKFYHIQFSFQICIVLKTCIFQIIFIGLCVCPL